MCLKPAAQIIFSIRMLKKSQDRESPYLKPRLASKGSDRLLPTFTTHWAFLSVISQSLISFAGMPNSDMVPHRWSLCGVSKADLKSTKRWNVLICLSRVFSKIWRSVKIWSMVDLLIWLLILMSETTLIRTNQFVNEWIQSLTQNARQDSICNRE